MAKYQDLGATPLYRVRGTTVCSPFVGELAERLGRVSFDRGALAHIREYGRLLKDELVFREIQWISPLDPCFSEVNLAQIEATLDQPAPEYDGKAWADVLINELTKTLRARLTPETKLWVLHSSGGDSRILSALLRIMSCADGPLWSEICFVCWYPEADRAREILLFEGWSDREIWRVERSSFLADPSCYWGLKCHDLPLNGFLVNGEIYIFGSARGLFDAVRRNYEGNNRLILSGNMLDNLIGAPPWYRHLGFSRNNSSQLQHLYSTQYHTSPHLSRIISGSARWHGLGALSYQFIYRLLIPAMSAEFVAAAVRVPMHFRASDRLRAAIQEQLCPGLSQIPPLDHRGTPASYPSAASFERLREQFRISEFRSRFAKTLPHIDETQELDEVLPGIGEYFQQVQGDSHAGTLPKYLALAGLHEYLVARNVRIEA